MMSNSESPDVRAPWPWPRGPRQPAHAPGEVHVWCTRLDPGIWPTDRLRLLLTDEERAKAARFVRPGDGTRYILARGLLRVLLGRYLQRDPETVALSTATGGKPVLQASTAAHPLRFNLSHSGNLCLYAFAQDRDIGVDIEAFRDDLELEHLARRFFSGDESALVAADAAAHRLETFFALWTCKEACMKATGQGLSFSLAALDVRSILSRAPGSVTAGSTRWWLMPLPVEKGYAGALAVVGDEPERVSLWSVADP